MSLILLFLRLVHSVCKFVVSFGLVVAWCCWLDCWLALSFYLLALVVSFYLLIGVVVLFVARCCRSIYCSVLLFYLLVGVVVLFVGLLLVFYLLLGVVVLFVGRFCCCLGWFMLWFAAVV